jgi:hypothetical protein
MASPVVVSRIQNRRGTQAQFDALYPFGYNGIGGADINLYPNILLQGELALCTDTRRVFIGNINGEYIEIQTLLDGIPPVVISLPPTAVFTVIPQLTYAATPFFNIAYDITDTVGPDWNAVGTQYSRNGELQITATVPFAPILNPPFPPLTPVTLTDTGTEINTVLPKEIGFMAQYNGSNIEILYMHDFLVPLTLSVTSIHWLPFV